MQHTIYYPRPRSASRHRKRIFILIGSITLAGISGFFLGSAIECIGQQNIEASYQRQIDALEQQVDYYKNLPTTGGLEA